MKLELSPSELEQDTTTGKNKYNATTSEATAAGKTYSADTTKFNVNGTINSEGFINFNYFTLSAGTYTLSCKLTKGSVENRFYVALADSNNTEYISSFELKSSNNYTLSKSFTIEEDKTLRFRLYVFTNNVFHNAEISYQVTTGSAGDYNFEPYTGGNPAPNPDFPMEVKVVKGDNSIKVENKNLLSTNSFTMTKGVNRTKQIDFATPIPAGTYTISCKIISKSGLTSSQGLSFQLIDGSVSPSVNRGSFNPILDSSTSPFSSKKTTTGQSTHLYIYLNNSLDDSATITIDELMLEKGESATSYQPYQTPQTQLISLGNIEYCKIGNYSDRIFKNVSGDTDYSSERDEGAWYIKKNIEKVVLDENSNIVQYDTNGRYYINGIIGQKGSSGNPNAMSNYFNGKFAVENGVIFVSGVDGSITMINTAYLNDLAGFKTWLGTTNPIIYYVLATPTYTKITGTLASQLENVYQKMLSYKGQTNILQVNNDLGFNINASALLDYNN